jgi:hypothetical protein
MTTFQNDPPSYPRPPAPPAPPKPSPLQATKRHLCPDCGSRLEMTTVIDVGSNRQAKFKSLVDWIIAPIDQCPLCEGMKGKADADVPKD